MKSKATLTLIELTVMLLVFALAAALCLQAFVWADTRSKEIGQEDKAYTCLQNASEILKASGGDFTAAAARFGGSSDGKVWTAQFDKSWQITGQNGVYSLHAIREDTGIPLLGSAKLEIADENGNTLAAWSVSWQEVAP